MARTRDLFEQLGFAGQMVHIDTFLKWRFGCEETHNKNAYNVRAFCPVLMRGAATPL